MGFSTKWIEWITNILNGSKTYINFNGELDPYFHCKKGVCQGDPFSPFLFILMADVLNIVLQNAKDKGYIKGLRCKGDFLGLINLYFADDILLLLEANPRYIEALKGILIAFEDISEFKINFEKCEMVPHNISAKERNV
jgi:Reverse transcriptase (RNA-dependent DNA polymerase)